MPKINSSNNTHCNSRVTASLGDSNALPVNFTWFTLCVWLFMVVAIVAIVAIVVCRSIFGIKGVAQQHGPGDA